MAGPFELIVEGLDFGEGPRWHQGRLWYSDFFQRAIYAVSEDGHRETVLGDLDDQPSGLGWMPDGSLLVVFMVSCRVMRQDGSGELVTHADLSAVASGEGDDTATWYCNDMVVDSRGFAYVGTLGVDLDNRRAVRTANLGLVRPDGSCEVAAEGLRLPNGSVITPDGHTLIVGESLGGAYQAFTIGEDGRLSDRRVWAEIPGTVPDGCCLDAGGGIWFADPRGSQLVRVLEGGEVTDMLPTPMPAFACMLGGSDGRTLYAVCGPQTNAKKAAGKAAGAIYATRADRPRVGLP